MSDYNSIRTFADSYGLGAMVVIFVTFVLWALRPGRRAHYDEAANLIFKEDGEGKTTDRSQHHG